MATRPNAQSVDEPEGEETDLRDDLEVDPPEDAPEDEPEPPQETDIERQAREMGWHPLAEYKGPPGRWKDAATFVKDGQNILPILRDNNKRLLETTSKQTTELAELKRTVAEQSQVLKELREMARTAGERGYQKALAELESQRREAAASGDVERYDQVSQQITVTEKEREKAAPKADPPAPAPAQPQVPQEIREFIAENSWYNEDLQLARAMQGEHVRLRTENPDQPLADNLAEALAVVKQRFPQKFPKPNGAARAAAPNRAPAPAQPSGNRGAQPRRNGNDPFGSIDDPAERQLASDQFKRWKNQMPDLSHEEFMAIWSDPKADILTIRRAMKEKSRGR